MCVCVCVCVCCVCVCMDSVCEAILHSAPPRPWSSLSLILFLLFFLKSGVDCDPFTGFDISTSHISYVCVCVCVCVSVVSSVGGRVRRFRAKALCRRGVPSMWRVGFSWEVEESRGRSVDRSRPRSDCVGHQSFPHNLVSCEFQFGSPHSARCSRWTRSWNLC